MNILHTSEAVAEGSFQPNPQRSSRTTLLSTIDNSRQIPTSIPRHQGKLW